jgi:hypothetical protein
MTPSLNMVCYSQSSAVSLTFSFHGSFLVADDRCSYDVTSTFKMNGEGAAISDKDPLTLARAYTTGVTIATCVTMDTIRCDCTYQTDTEVHM